MHALTIREFNEDKRGAVMLTGLGMSLFLIGALWFLIGIGDAIVFRDRMQEVADSAAFTSASVHAKGMNFLAMCNIILLIMFVIHIIMGIVHDIMLILAILGFGIPLPAYLKWKGWWDDYHRQMKPVAQAIHGVEFAIAYGYPLLATYEGYKIGKEYDEDSAVKRNLTTIPLSLSLIPGNAIDIPLNKIFQAAGQAAVDNARKSAKEGENATIFGIKVDDESFTSPKRPKAALPVVAVPNLAACRKIGMEAGQPVLDLAVRIAGKGLPEILASMIQGQIYEFIQIRYCNPGKIDPNAGAPLEKLIRAAMEEMQRKLDKKGIFSAVSKVLLAPLREYMNQLVRKLAARLAAESGVDPGFDKFWGEDGPYLPWDGAGNGSPWNQVWAMNYKPEFKDTSKRLVALASRDYSGTTEIPDQKKYWAQAEFYFDCAGYFWDRACNGGYGDDNAGYSLKWRARLKRLEFPALGSLFTGYAFQFIQNLNFYRDVKGGISGKITKEINDITGGVGTPLTKGIIASGVTSAFAELEREISTKTTGPLGTALDPRYGSSYH